MLVGYARVSKADGSQVCDLQIDALVEAGVSEDAILLRPSGFCWATVLTSYEGALSGHPTANNTDIAKGKNQ